MEEVWKYVEQYDLTLKSGGWKYEVSNLGNVRMAGYQGVDGEWHDSFPIKQQVDKRGYHSVALYDKAHKQYRVYVHKLVAITFLDNPTNAKSVSHKNGDLSDNSVSNLHWGVLRNPPKQRYTLKGRGRPVRQYTLSGEFVAEHPNARSAAKAVYSSSYGPISYCCQRHPDYKSAAGFIWRYPWDDEFAK